MNEKESALLNKLYQELDINNQKFARYLSYIEKLDGEKQKSIYETIRTFLLEKKTYLLRYKKNIEYQRLIKKINYWIYQIDLKFDAISPKLNKNDFKKEKKKKIIKISTDIVKPKINSPSVINEKEDDFNDEITFAQQEVLEHMKLELDILSNNTNDIVVAYKEFIRNTDIEFRWDYIVKISDFLLHKIETLPQIEGELYRNMIIDCLKYKKASIPKEKIQEKARIKKLQDIWRQELNIKNEIKIDIFSKDYKEQIRNIMVQTKNNKEESIMLWLDEIESVIAKCTNEELEIIISNLSKVSDSIKEESIKERLNLILKQYSYIFENYFDTYIVNMNVPKNKQEVLDDLKKLIKKQEIINENNNSYQLFYTIIFKEKDLSSLKRLLSMDPKFINIKNYDNTYLLENILDLLINQIMNNKYYFLENVFLVFLKYSGIYMNQDLRNNLVRKINDTRDLYEEQYNLDCILSNLLCKLDNITLLNDLKVGEEDIYTHKKQKASYKMFNNLLNRTIITIDQKDTKYFENAISCDALKDGRYMIGVYVSDVVDCLNEDLIIENNDLHHKEYKTTLNRYTKHILKQGKVKFAIAFTFITDEELNVIDFNVERARIRVKKNYTFDEAIQVLDQGDTEDKLFYVLQRINNVARMMYRKRNPKGCLKKYMEFIPEIQREFTFFANRYVAKDAVNNDLLLIYKNQLPKESINLFEYLESNCNPAERIEKITGAISSDKMSSYSTINRGNAYFNGEEYTQVTSPTRELASLLNQILIINNYIDKEYIDIEEKDNLEKILMLVNKYNNPKK